MATPDKDTVNAEAAAAKAAIQTAANDLFIASADAAIADYANRGHYMVRLTLVENMDLKTVVTHYQNLGYTVAAPLPPNIGEQPAQLFGTFWTNYWENQQLWFTINGFYQIKEIYIYWS